MRTLDVCLAVRICGDIGIPRDSLDVCFGDQLAEPPEAKRSLLKPSGVVGDGREHAETDLAALHQNPPENHDDSGRKRWQLLQQNAKTLAPWWAPTVVVLSLTVM